MASTSPPKLLPKQQRAIVAQGPGKLAIHHNASMPTLRPDMAIVRTAAVAINPSDAKMLDYSATAGAIVSNALVEYLQSPSLSAEYTNKFATKRHLPDTCSLENHRGSKEWTFG